MKGDASTAANAADSIGTASVPHPLPNDGSLLFDGTIRYPGYSGKLTKCRIRVYDASGTPVVVCTELPDNVGTSITNAAEIIATLVWTAMGRPGNMVWIEHYPDRAFIGPRPMFKENFDIVRFERSGNVLRRPRWRRIPKCEAESLAGSAL